MNNKNKYVIRIEETLVKDIVVEARDENEAILKVEDAYTNEAIVLDSSDFCAVSVSDATDCYKDYEIDGKFNDCTIGYLPHFEDILE